MSITDVILAVEDELSEAISMKILGQFDINVRHTILGKGNVSLRQRAPEFNRVAKSVNIFLLTDLDSLKDCPPGLINAWIKGPKNPGFLIRVAVMEVESWVMTDRIGFSDFLSIPLHRFPTLTDEILNPKEFLVSLARRSQRKSIREALVPLHTTNLNVGVEYNILLSEFVHDNWNLQNAAAVSASLKRTLDRLTYIKETEN